MYFSILYWQLTYTYMYEENKTLFSTENKAIHHFCIGPKMSEMLESNAWVKLMKYQCSICIKIQVLSWYICRICLNMILHFILKYVPLMKSNSAGLSVHIASEKVTVLFSSLETVGFVMGWFWGITVCVRVSAETYTACVWHGYLRPTCLRDFRL